MPTQNFHFSTGLVEKKSLMCLEDRSPGAPVTQARSGARHPPSRPAHADGGGAPVDGMDWLVPAWALPPAAVRRPARQSPTPRPVGRSATPNPSPPPSKRFLPLAGRPEGAASRDGRPAARAGGRHASHAFGAKDTPGARHPPSASCVASRARVRVGAAPAGRAGTLRRCRGRGGGPWPAAAAAGGTPRAAALFRPLLPADRRPCRPPAAGHDAARQQWQALAAVGLPPLAPPRGGGGLAPPLPATAPPPWPQRPRGEGVLRAARAPVGGPPAAAGRSRAPAGGGGRRWRAHTGSGRRSSVGERRCSRHTCAVQAGGWGKQTGGSVARPPLPSCGWGGGGEGSAVRSCAQLAWCGCRAQCGLGALASEVGSRCVLRSAVAAAASLA